jgi:hypothetical protein
VSERCAQMLARRGADFGLPPVPAGLRHGIPSEIVGERVVAPVHLPPRRPRRPRRRPRAGRRRAPR